MSKPRENRTPVFNRADTCHICGRYIRKNGHAGHALAHVTRGEAQSKLVHWADRYLFRVTPKGHAVRRARMRQENASRRVIVWPGRRRV